MWKITFKGKSIIKKIKKIDKSENNKELNILINNCLEIENNINNINDIEQKIKKSEEIKQTKIVFYPNKEEIDKFLENIKLFCRVDVDKGNSFNLSSIIINSLNYQNLFNLINNLCKYQL